MTSIARIAELLVQHLDPEDAAVAVTTDDIVEITSPVGGLDRAVQVHVRDIAELEIAFVVPSRSGSPFEALFTGSIEEEDAIIDAAVNFVSDLIGERVVLAWDSRLFRGGQRFLSASEFSQSAKRQFAWAVSWSGEHDWDAPDV